jgi:hypothetical protein
MPMPRFIDRLRRRRPSDDQALLADIVGQHDEASGAAAQRGKPVRRTAQPILDRPSTRAPRGDQVGWWRSTMLITVFVGLVIYVALDPPHIIGVTERSPRPGEIDSEFAGTVRVVDGDTMSIREHRLRLAGIDAPEKAQTCRRDGRTWHCGDRRVPRWPPGLAVAS